MAHRSRQHALASLGGCERAHPLRHCKRRQARVSAMGRGTWTASSSWQQLGRELQKLRLSSHLPSGGSSAGRAKVAPFNTAFTTARCSKYLSVLDAQCVHRWAAQPMQGQAAALQEAQPGTVAHRHVALQSQPAQPRCTAGLALPQQGRTQRHILQAHRGNQVCVTAAVALRSTPSRVASTQGRRCVWLKHKMHCTAYQSP